MDYYMDCDKNCWYSHKLWPKYFIIYMYFYIEIKTCLRLTLYETHIKYDNNNNRDKAND